MTPNSYRFDPSTYPGLDKLGRVPLSPSFHMREFLYSEVAVQYGLRNVPDQERVGEAVFAGSMLCKTLLEPLQEVFGRLHIRSGYRSREVNAAGGEHSCAADNDGVHTWDYPSSDGHGRGATACISIPRVSAQVLDGKVSDLAIAWWIYDHLPDWSYLEFFATRERSNELTFNIGWHEKPMKVIQNRRGGVRSVHNNLPDAEERRSAWDLLVRLCALNPNKQFSLATQL